MDKLIENWTVLEMLKRRLMDAESLGGQCEIDAEELSAAINVIERAVEALTFYAAKGNYGVRKVVSGVRYSDADLDGGSKARETLSLINGVEP